MQSNGVLLAVCLFAALTIGVVAAAEEVTTEFTFKQYPDGTVTRAAMAELEGAIQGKLTFVQIGDGIVTISGKVTGLAPGKHGFHIHQNGNITGGCMAAGPHFNPENKKHGGPDDVERHVGDLGNIMVDATGVADVKLEDRVISLTGPHGILNRAVVVHSHEDDLGRGGYPDSLTTGHAGDRAGCGIIKIKFPAGPWTDGVPAAGSASDLKVTSSVFTLCLSALLARLL